MDDFGMLTKLIRFHDHSFLLLAGWKCKIDNVRV